MLFRVLAIYPSFDPAINEMAMAWEKCASAGDVEFLAFAPTYDQLKNTASRKIATRDNAKLVLHQEFFQTDDLFVNRRKDLGPRFMLPSIARYLRSNILKQVEPVSVSDPFEAKNSKEKSSKLRYLPWPHPEPEGIIAAEDRDRNESVYIGSGSLTKNADILAEYLCELLRQFPKKKLELVGPIIDATGKAARDRISDCAGKRLVYRPCASRNESMKILSGAPFVFVPGTSLNWGLIGDAWRRGTLVIAQAANYDLVKDENCIVVRTAAEFIKVVKKLEGDPKARRPSNIRIPITVPQNEPWRGPARWFC